MINSVDDVQNKLILVKCLTNKQLPKQMDTAQIRLNLKYSFNEYVVQLCDFEINYL